MAAGGAQIFAPVYRKNNYSGERSEPEDFLEWTLPVLQNFYDPGDFLSQNFYFLTEFNNFGFISQTDYLSFKNFQK